MLLESDGALDVGGEAGVVDGEDVGMGGKGGGDEGGVMGGFTGAEVESLEAAVGEKAVEGGGDGADGVLEEGKAVADGGGVKGGGTHQDVLFGYQARALGKVLVGRRRGLTECPFMYLVTEWMTISAPWSRGFWT